MLEPVVSFELTLKFPSRFAPVAPFSSLLSLLSFQNQLMTHLLKNRMIILQRIVKNLCIYTDHTSDIPFIAFIA